MDQENEHVNETEQEPGREEQHEHHHHHHHHHRHHHRHSGGGGGIPRRMRLPFFVFMAIIVIGVPTFVIVGQQLNQSKPPVEDNEVQETHTHSYDEWIEEIPATETEEGVKGHYHCAGCGKDFDRDGTELTDLVIPCS